MNDKTYRSDAFEAVHDIASEMAQRNLISAETMREFDQSCLTTVVPLDAAEIRGIRRQAHVSQRVFAMHLNITVSLVSQWERGVKKPSGPALKLLTLVKVRGLDAVR
ncbi:MAG: DNA-binding transcriptional regulator [Fimbriimonadaceae bacterium]|nr:DNA-binding transcriptional regulator [Fimbriimonadaceae bacterium]